MRVIARHFGEVSLSGAITRGEKLDESLNGVIVDFALSCTLVGLIRGGADNKFIGSFSCPTTLIGLSTSGHRPHRDARSDCEVGKGELI